MALISKSFSAVGSSDQLLVPSGTSVSFSIGGTFSGKLQIEKSIHGIHTAEIVAGPYTLNPSVAAGILSHDSPDRSPAIFRFHCQEYISGTADCKMSNVDAVLSQLTDRFGNVLFEITDGGIRVAKRVGQKRIYQLAKPGTIAGFVVNAVDNKNSMAKLPPGHTGSALVVPLSGLKVGDTVTGFNLVGQVESSGSAVTINASLRKQTSAAADLVDGLIASMPAVVLNSDRILSSANTGMSALSEVVGPDETLYVLITATTGALCDIDLQGVVIESTDA